MNRGKKGDTLVNFAFIIGMLILAGIIIVVLSRFSLVQTRALTQDALLDFTANLKNTLEKAQSSPNDADFIIRLQKPLQYTLSIDKGRVRMDFPQYSFQAEPIFFSANTNVIGRKVENSGIIHVSKRGNTILVTDDMTCTPDDGICDPACIIMQKCDKDCYENYLYDVCNPYCVDTNRDGHIDQKDLDNTCDPDCYGRDARGGAYDPDCLVRDDNICDPNTDGKGDGFCDTDCLDTNGVCDPDCTAYDADCPHQDNGFCETQRGETCLNSGGDCTCDANLQLCRLSCPSIPRAQNGCINISDLYSKGSACTAQCQCAPGLVCDTIFGTNHCCSPGEYFDSVTGACMPNVGDGVCKPQTPFGETCANSTADCACASGTSCCVGGAMADAKGCVAPSKNEGETCTCDAECVNPVVCDEKGGHCCPADMEWDPTQSICIIAKKFKLVIVPINYDFPSERTRYEGDANNFWNHWHKNSPVQTCPNPDDREEKLLLDADCTAARSGCYGAPGGNPNSCSPSCYNAIVQCARAQYGFDFDKAEGLFNGDMGNYIGGGKVLGCAGNSNLGVPPHLGSRWGGAVHETAQGNGNGGGSSHELGHDFGLCHNRCLSTRPGQCPNNDACDNSAIMAYGPKIYWAPGEASHLRTHLYFAEYLGGCS